MKAYKNPKKERSFRENRKLSEKLSSSSDFGIPKRLIPGLSAKIYRHKNLRLYLSFLLNRMRSGKFNTHLPFFDGPKSKYQDYDQDLEYLQFRPYNKDWIELMMIARARGGSATLLFVFLLELDLKDQNLFDWRKYSVTRGNWIPSKPIRFLQVLNLKTGWWRRELRFGRSTYHFRKKKPFQRD